MIIFKMVLGHLVGDYLLQNQWMALNKSKNTLIGWFAAIIHCFIYMASVCLIMEKYDFLWIVIVFNSHFWIDKFALADKYKKIIGSSTMKNFVHRYDNMFMYIPYSKPDITRKDIIEGAFAAITYTITDNTLHIIIMYIFYNIIS